MQCPQCQHENRDTANFCEACGSSLARRCPACDNEARAGATFCDHCGTRLASSPPTPPETTPITQDDLPVTKPSASEAERRQLTVMFCDLVGSTPLASQLDPEDLREVVRAYQERAAAVIQQYEGHIAQYLGDGLLIYFGWPRAHEDDAHRAVHTGLGIVEAVDDLNTTLETSHGVQLAVRLGIHTGSVVVGEVGGGGRHENLALGETPNIAARLEGLAQPGAVVISDDTRRLVAGAFNYDTLGTPELKGVSESIPVFRVLGLSAAASRFEATTTTLTPMVGREVEVDLLMRCWEQVLEGEGQVVLLNGPPGIGKSRLLQALCDALVDVPQVRLRYQCSPYHTNSALYPIATQLTRAMQLFPDADLDAKLERLEALVTQTGLPMEEAVPLFAVMLSIPMDDRYAPLSLNPQRQKERTLELFAQGVVNLARQEPVLFLFEDLHWSDPTSLEALSLILDQVQDARVLMVLTYRPEFEPAWRDYVHVTTYTLNRLSRRQTVRLVEQVAGGKALPAEVLDQIVAKTDGIPLFVEELTKHVLESAWLMDAGERYQLTSPLPPLAIPETLQDSLTARLDRLAEVKEVAQLGATIGREFSYALLRAVSPLSDTALEDALGQLLDADLIAQRGSVPESTYSFKHALIQDAAYQSMLRSTRQQVHQEIAQVLVTQFAETVETQPELVAHHYTEAACPEQAISYWQRAGQRAMQRSANVEAVNHLTGGLALLTALPETPEHVEQEIGLQTALGQALMAAKGQGVSEVEHAFSRALALCRQVGESPHLFSVIWGMWRFYYIVAKLRTALELGEQCFSLAQRAPDPVLLLPSHFALGSTFHMLGEFTSGRAHLEQAIALYDPLRHRELAFSYGIDLKIWCLSYVAWTLWHLGYPEQAIRRSHEALRLARELTHPFSLAGTLDYLAWLHQLRHEAPATQQHAEEAIALAREHGFPQYEALGMSICGWALAAQGQQHEGLAQLRQGNIASRAAGAELGYTNGLTLLADACGKAGQVAEGQRVINEAMAVVDQTGARVFEAELYRLKGELLPSQSPDNAAEAETYFHQAIDIARSQQAKSLELRAATSLTRLWLSQGKRQEACDLLAPVYGWFTEGFDTADLQDAKHLLDELSVDSRPPTA